MDRVYKQNVFFLLLCCFSHLQGSEIVGGRIKADSKTVRDSFNKLDQDKLKRGNRILLGVRNDTDTQINFVVTWTTRICNGGSSTYPVAARATRLFMRPSCEINTINVAGNPATAGLTLNKAGNDSIQVSGRPDGNGTIRVGRLWAVSKNSDSTYKITQVN